MIKGIRLSPLSSSKNTIELLKSIDVIALQPDISIKAISTKS